MTMHIRTDRKWKQFKYRDEVPAKILKNEFDWLDDETYDGFFKHHGTWFHLSQFERIPPGADELAGWDGYAGSSYSTGDLIKVSKDGEEYMVASYYVTS
jgi:hypothetical protein